MENGCAQALTLKWLSGLADTMLSDREILMYDVLGTHLTFS